MQNFLSGDASPQTAAAEPAGVGAIVFSSIFALLVGAVVGVITTFTHALWVPWGLVAGLLITTALVAGFRLVFESRVVGAAAALGVVAASAALAFPGAGGVILTLGTVPGLIWTIGPMIVSAVVLGWRRSARRTARA